MDSSKNKMIILGNKATRSTEDSLWGCSQNSTTTAPQIRYQVYMLITRYPGTQHLSTGSVLTDKMFRKLPLLCW